MSDRLALRIDEHLRALATVAGHRPPGSPANRRATDLVEAALAAAGLTVRRIPFHARWWEPGAAALTVDGRPVPIDPPPFAADAAARGVVTEVADDEALARLSPDPARIVVLRHGLAVPHFPKAFPFVTLPDQQQRIARLEALRPAAVLAVVADEDAPEPGFEDPDLAFPYATIPAAAAMGLSDGAVVELRVEAALHEGVADQVSAGTLSGPRSVVCAHVDSKVTTPGALDNAGGVAALLALAEQGLDGLGPVELVFFNGEDHYDAPGERAWLAEVGLGDIRLVVNIDGAGLRDHPTAVSRFGGDDALAAALARAIAERPDVIAGEPWFESDHAVFAMQGIPAIAITSGAPVEVLRRLAHAPDDTPDRLDPRRLAGVVGVIRSVLGPSASAAP